MICIRPSDFVNPEIHQWDGRNQFRSGCLIIEYLTGKWGLLQGRCRSTVYLDCGWGKGGIPVEPYFYSLQPHLISPPDPYGCCLRAKGFQLNLKFTAGPRPELIPFLK